jgi:hypothetical protein
VNSQHTKNPDAGHGLIRQPLRRGHLALAFCSSQASFLRRLRLSSSCRARAAPVNERSLTQCERRPAPRRPPPPPPPPGPGPTVTDGDRAVALTDRLSHLRARHPASAVGIPVVVGCASQRDWQGRGPARARRRAGSGARPGQAHRPDPAPDARRGQGTDRSVTGESRLRFKFLLAEVAAGPLKVTVTGQ